MSFTNVKQVNDTRERRQQFRGKTGFGGMFWSK